MKKHTGPIKQYLPCKDELTINNGILLRGSRLVIPPALRPDIIEKLYMLDIRGLQNVSNVLKTQYGGLRLDKT